MLPRGSQGALPPPARGFITTHSYVHYGLDPANYETNILLKNGVAYFKADGSMRHIQGLGFPWVRSRQPSSASCPNAGAVEAALRPYRPQPLPPLRPQRCLLRAAGEVSRRVSGVKTARNSQPRVFFAANQRHTSHAMTRTTPATSAMSSQWIAACTQACDFQARPELIAQGRERKAPDGSGPDRTCRFETSCTSRMRGKVRRRSEHDHGQQRHHVP